MDEELGFDEESNIILLNDEIFIIVNSSYKFLPTSDSTFKAFVKELTNILYFEIIKGNIQGISTAVSKAPNTKEDLDIVLTKELVDILNTNSYDIQITLKDLERPVNGKYTVVKKIGSRGVRLTLNDLINNISI